jgi:hypothetical protein
MLLAANYEEILLEHGKAFFLLPLPTTSYFLL